MDESGTGEDLMSEGRMTTPFRGADSPGRQRKIPARSRTSEGRMTITMEKV